MNGPHQIFGKERTPIPNDFMQISRVVQNKKINEMAKVLKEHSFQDK